MIKVITPFSLLNDDFKSEKGRVFPAFSVRNYDNSSTGGVQIPFLVLFTDKNR